MLIYLPNAKAHTPVNVQCVLLHCIYDCPTPSKGSPSQYGLLTTPWNLFKGHLIKVLCVLIKLKCCFIVAELVRFTVPYKSI